MLQPLTTLHAEHSILLVRRTPPRDNEAQEKRLYLRENTSGRERAPQLHWRLMLIYHLKPTPIMVCGSHLVLRFHSSIDLAPSQRHVGAYSARRSQQMLARVGAIVQESGLSSIPLPPSLPRLAVASIPLDDLDRTARTWMSLAGLPLLVFISVVGASL